MSEAKINEIRDALQDGNNKVALRLSDVLLRKKAVGSQTVRLLKSLALLGLERFKECDQLCDAVAKEKPTDSQTLQLLSSIYMQRENGMLTLRRVEIFFCRLSLL